MTVQTVAYALQNASHSAALFRQSASAPWLSGGPVASGELVVAAQGTPNMSVSLGAGRAKVVGTQSSPPAGVLFTTQGMYDVLNDGPLTLTVATSNPTNPRIDAVYVAVQDSFYSGGSNAAIAGVATGTPAPSPVAPAIPSNAVLLAYVAVAANATSIVGGNITNQTVLAQLQPSPTQGMALLSPASAVNGTVSALGRVTFSGQTSVSLNGLFTAQYDNYRLIGSVVMTAANLLQYNLRAAGVDNASANYAYQAIQGSGASASAGGITGQTAAYLINQASTNSDVDVNIIAPFLTSTTRIVSTHFAVNGSTQAAGIIASTQGQSTSFDGLTLKTASGTMSGTLRVYGWNNG
jgi:hypothetical protein